MAGEKSFPLRTKRRVQQRVLTEDSLGVIQSVRSVIEARRQRGCYFNSELFADPGWDILLELYAGALAGQPIAVTKLCQVSGVPETTALRWIGKLQTEGLLSRHQDPFDGRRVWVALSEDGLKAMEAYWENISLSDSDLDK